MGALSVIMIAAGAILKFAVSDRADGVELGTVGIILMIVGAIGLLLSLLWWDRLGFGYWRRGDYVEGAGPRYGGRRARRTVVEEDVPPPAPPPDY